MASSAGVRLSMGLSECCGDGDCSLDRRVWRSKEWNTRRGSVTRIDGGG